MTLIDLKGRVQDYMFWYNNPDKCFTIGQPEEAVLKLELEYHDVELIIKALDLFNTKGLGNIRSEDMQRQLERIHGPVEGFEEFYDDKSLVLAMWMKNECNVNR